MHYRLNANQSKLSIVCRGIVFLTLIDAAHDNGSAVLCGASNLTPRCFPTLILSEPMNRLLFVRHVGQMFDQPRSVVAFVKAVVCTRSLRNEKYGREWVGWTLTVDCYREHTKRHRGRIASGKGCAVTKTKRQGKNRWEKPYRFLGRVITRDTTARDY